MDADAELLLCCARLDTGPEQRRVDRLEEVCRAHHEDHLVRPKPIHLGEELVHHRVLDPGSLVHPTGRGEGVELVEDDDRRRALAGANEDLAQVLFALRPGLVVVRGARQTQQFALLLDGQRLVGLAAPGREQPGRDAGDVARRGVALSTGAKVSSSSPRPAMPMNE